ncbi:MAG: sialate O-acetylesterase [Aureliella sp.]
MPQTVGQSPFRQLAVDLGRRVVVKKRGIRRLASSLHGGSQPSTSGRAASWLNALVLGVLFLGYRPSICAADEKTTVEHADGKNGAASVVANDLHLFVLAGQSNMAGRGKVEPQDQEEDSRILVFDKSNKWKIAVDPLHFDKPRIVGVGLARSFARDYLKSHPGVRVGLIPCAVGGSPVRTWEPGALHESTGAHPFDDCVSRVGIASQAGSLKGILWHQGEGDSNEKNAPQYEAKLARLFDVLRSRFEMPNLPIVVGQMGVFRARPWGPHRTEVDRVHKRLSKLIHRCEFVSSIGLTHKGDEVHFDSASYRELGHRYYSAYERIVRRKEAASLDHVKRIWSESQHQAFTDLVRFRDSWYCVFREGSAHVSPDGQIRVLRSADGLTWKTAKVFQDAESDLRDAKISVTPEGKLLVIGAGARNDHSAGNPGGIRHQSYAWISDDGSSWASKKGVGDPNYWLWRVDWHQGQGLGIGYRTNRPDDRDTRLYSTKNGLEFELLKRELFSDGYPNESSIAYTEQDVAYCLLRRDPHGGKSGTGQLGTAVAPFTEWEWKDLGVRIGGPKMILLPDGRLLAIVRLYDGHTRTSLCWLDPQQATLTEFFRLPSGGDTSYAGAVWHEDQLHVSYYSQHESLGQTFKTAIYFAKLSIP